MLLISAMAHYKYTLRRMTLTKKTTQNHLSSLSAAMNTGLPRYCHYSAQRIKSSIQAGEPTRNSRAVHFAIPP